MSALEEYEERVDQSTTGATTTAPKAPEYFALKKLEERVKICQNKLDVMSEEIKKRLNQMARIEPNAQESTELDESWNWDTIGTDYKSIREPLTREHLKHLKKNKIEFGRQIAVGSFGSIYEITAPRDGKIVKMACKVIRIRDPPIKDQNTLRQAVEAARAGIQMLSRLNHPNICGYFDEIDLPDWETRFPFAAICFLMELCVGNLGSLLEQQQMASKRWCKLWFKQIAEAVRYLHCDENMAHLDIKLNHILYHISSSDPDLTTELVFRNSVFKLTDFRLAVQFPSDTPEDQCITDQKNISSADYIAPEMYNTSGVMIRAKPCDIYSLAISLVATLMSRSSLNTLNEYVQYENWTSYFVPDYMDTETAHLIERMMDWDPNTRLTIVEVLDHQWLQ